MGDREPKDENVSDWQNIILRQFFENINKNEKLLDVLYK